MFVDVATIIVRSGKGGAGCVSFHREKFCPRMGPDGGKGGKGGDVILRVDKRMRTLLDFRYRRVFKAQNGKLGEGNNRSGKDGNDIIIPIPPGTVVYKKPDKIKIADLVDGSVVVAKGGRGGFGNAHFVTPTNQSPRYAQPGEPGEEIELLLELKLIADVGLVGFPNAGKSTLLSKLTAARPKIADYPFTTLVPNLGIVKVGNYDTFLMADIPGLIEGAHLGKGLGHDFLRHIERTRSIVYVIDAAQSPLERFDALRTELRLHNPSLVERPFVVFLNKSDILSQEQRDDVLSLSLPHPVVLGSAVTGEGLTELVSLVDNQITESSVVRQC